MHNQTQAEHRQPPVMLTADHEHVNALKNELLTELQHHTTSFKHPNQPSQAHSTFETALGLTSVRPETQQLSFSLLVSLNFTNGTLFAGQLSILFLLWLCLPFTFCVHANRCTSEVTVMNLFGSRCHGTVFSKINESEQWITRRGSGEVREYTSPHADGGSQPKPGCI